MFPHALHLSQQHTWLAWKSSEAEAQVVPMSPHFQTLRSVTDQLWTTTGAVPHLPRTGRIFHLGALWRGMFLRQGSNSTWGGLLSSCSLAAAVHPSDPKGICTRSFELFHYKNLKCSSPSTYNHFLPASIAKTCYIVFWRAFQFPQLYSPQSQTQRRNKALGRPREEDAMGCFLNT